MIFKKLFGSKSEQDDQLKKGDPVEYDGFTITPEPRPQNSQFLTAGIIEKELAGESRSQLFIRADCHASWDDACSHAERKGKQIIDEQGDALFRDDNMPR